MSKEELQDHQWLACLPQVLDFETVYLDVCLDEADETMDIYFEDVSKKIPA